MKVIESSRGSTCPQNAPEPNLTELRTWKIHPVHRVLLSCGGQASTSLPDPGVPSRSLCCTHDQCHSLHLSGADWCWSCDTHCYTGCTNPDLLPSFSSLCPVIYGHLVRFLTDYKGVNYYYYFLIIHCPGERDIILILHKF